MTVPSLDWVLVAAALAAVGWQGGLWIVAYTVAALRWTARVGYPRMRTRWLCPKGNHRRVDRWTARDASYEWWHRTTVCRDCRAEIRRVEVHREEVPAAAKGPPVVRLSDLLGAMKPKDDEPWK